MPQLGVAKDALALPKEHLCLKRSATLLFRREVILAERSPTLPTGLEQESSAEART